jgi:AraC-like DNA-binding protein
MSCYREFGPPPHLAEIVECFWTHGADARLPSYRVLPDGCMDILFTRQQGEPAALTVVGAMTRVHEFALPAGRVTIGMRFRPGMAVTLLPVPGDDLTDTAVALEAVLGRRARSLHERLANAGSLEEHIVVLQQSLAPPTRPAMPVQKAIAALVSSQGDLRVEDLANMSNLSPRQFRRQCLNLTGLTPKRLARVLRFRAATTHAGASTRPDWARLAAECGYYDQAHLIRDFTQLAGRTPAQHWGERMLASAQT